MLEHTAQPDVSGSTTNLMLGKSRENSIQRPVLLGALREVEELEEEEIFGSLERADHESEQHHRHYSSINA